MPCMSHRYPCLLVEPFDDPAVITDPLMHGGFADLDPILRHSFYDPGRREACGAILKRIRDYVWREVSAHKAGVVREPSFAVPAPVPAYLPALVPAHPALVAVPAAAEPARHVGLPDQHLLEPVVCESSLPHDHPGYGSDVFASPVAMNVVWAGALPAPLPERHVVVCMDD